MKPARIRNIYTFLWIILSTIVEHFIEGLATQSANKGTKYKYLINLPSYYLIILLSQPKAVEDMLRIN